MDIIAVGLFLLAAIALLGSPGPAIAALLAIGRARGFRRSMRYNLGLQLGLALAAGGCALGLLSIVLAFPVLAYLLSVGAAIYLLYLAYRIVTSPVGVDGQQGHIPDSMWAGFFLGVSNPKAYIAFVSLYASYAVYPNDPTLDLVTKWLLCVMVMIIVDTIWLSIGVMLGRVQLAARYERGLNRVFAVMIVAATLAMLL